MEHFLELLSLGVSLAAILLMICVVLVNIYIIKREGFRVKVNCWFCNTWTKVLYANKNSFECPNCLQYNGFTNDGSYNKVINAQHNTSLIRTVDKARPASNGLCTYCNNNQRLKVHQLANFVPLNENNYDVEIEHFKKQLEKSYKLCNKCETVLKVTLSQQQAWLFGNRLKSFKTKALKVINSAKDLNKENKLLFIRYSISILNMLMLCYLLNVKIELPSFSNTKQLIPSYFKPYTVIVKHYYVSMTNTSRTFVESFFDLNQVNVDTNFMSIVTTLGFLLQFLLVLTEEFSNWWKVNEMLAWILLFLTSSVPSNSVYAGQIKVLQIFISSVLLYGYMRGKSLSKEHKTNCQFKKINNTNDISENNDEDHEETLHSSFCSIKSRKSTLSNDFNSTHCQFYRAASSPLQNCQFQNNFNDSYATAKTSSILNSSHNSGSPNPNNDLHRSLDNLHLTNLSFRPQPCSSPVFCVKRPVLSPPKLKTVTQNPWTAGGFWKNDVTAYQVGVDDNPNPSRSSSQSSGFVSNQAFNSLPASREPSICGDLERSSILSEPTYHMNSFASKSPRQQLYYKADNNTFYPVLNQNNMLYLPSSVPNLGSSFSSLPVNGAQSRSNAAPNSVLYSDKPISNLFKNFQTSGISDCSFSTARF